MAVTREGAGMGSPLDPRRDADGRAGREMYALIERLFPICRSLTGGGVRATLAVIGESLPLAVHEVPSGTRVYDWTVPDEWNIRDAFIKNRDGQRVVDFQSNNLHVMSYSAPVHATLSRRELEAHLHSLPEHPDRVPYRTSYYAEGWAFCLSHRQRQSLGDGDYEVAIDSTLAPGSLSYGECVLPGSTDEEVLFYTHTCHPSLANDNLSGIAVCTFLARWLADRPRRYTYRFVFGPGTLGSLVWLSRNEARLDRIRYGLVAVLLGDGGPLRYKCTRHGSAAIDRIVKRALVASARPHAIEPFSPFGYDERQFGSPGFDLPVGRLSRSANGGYPEYHTSADDLSVVSPQALAESLSACMTVVAGIEGHRCFRNLEPKGEPQLGRRGLYRREGGAALPERELAMLWILTLSDGAHSLDDVAEASGLEPEFLSEVARDLVGAGLLAAAPG